MSGPSEEERFAAQLDAEIYGMGLLYTTGDPKFGEAMTYRLDPKSLTIVWPEGQWPKVLPARLAELRGLAEAASDGPYVAENPGASDLRGLGTRWHLSRTGHSNYGFDQEDAEFIAAACNFVLELLSESDPN